MAKAATDGRLYAGVPPLLGVSISQIGGDFVARSIVLAALLRFFFVVNFHKFVELYRSAAASVRVCVLAHERNGFDDGTLALLA